MEQFFKDSDAFAETTLQRVPTPVVIIFGFLVIKQEILTTCTAIVYSIKSSVIFREEGAKTCASNVRLDQVAQDENQQASPGQGQSCDNGWWQPLQAERTREGLTGYPNI